MRLPLPRVDVNTDLGGTGPAMYLGGHEYPAGQRGQYTSRTREAHAAGLGIEHRPCCTCLMLQMGAGTARAVPTPASGVRSSKMTLFAAVRAWLEAVRNAHVIISTET